VAGSDQIHDYVIVGGGSAGCVLANRLSADPANRVCLIEAGPRDSSPVIHIPAGVIALINHRRLNWNWLSAPQDDAGGRQIKVPRGKTLGGSSAINGMIYMRGHPLDYDEWASAGNPGWAFSDVLPYFKKSENNQTFGETEFHGAVPYGLSLRAVPRLAWGKLLRLDDGVEDDQGLSDYIRAFAATIFHPVGTCAMGREEDAEVDPELRVHGVNALRVVDASIMPTIIGGNTNAPTLMIAEKAADMILGQ